jgi:hypothetical protein
MQRNSERTLALVACQGTLIYRLEYRCFPSSKSAEMIEQVYAKVGNFWLPPFNRSSSEIRLGGWVRRL